MTDTNSAITVFTPKTLQDIKLTAELFLNSRLVGQATAAQIAVKIMAGAELGLMPFDAVNELHIIPGQNGPRVSASGNLIARRIKEHPGYDYSVEYLGDDGCRIAFYEIANGERVLLGISEFMREHAEKAGLLTKFNWKSYPRNMYFNRALSNGQRWYAPNSLGSKGTRLYTHDELGLNVDENDNVIDAPIGQPEPPPTDVIEGEWQDTPKSNGNAPKGAQTGDAPQAAENSLPPTEHWTSDQGRVGKFFAWCVKQGLGTNDALAALQVEDITEYNGDPDAAIARVRAYVDWNVTPDGPKPWKDRKELLQRILDAGYANAKKHAINMLEKLTREERADERWSDAIAFEAVELYRMYGDDTPTDAMIAAAAELGGEVTQAPLLDAPAQDTTYAQ